MTAERLGRYRLLRVLGTGGMGVVHEAELEGPHGFRKRVALKVLSARFEDVEAPIVAEARLGGLVQHPNIVSTLELAEDDGRWFMSMELVGGPTASALVKRGGALPLRAALDIGAQAAAGLHYLHTLTVDGADRPLVHRDIKPSNLMLDPSGLLKIVDLGISGFRAPGEAIGTPGYMPPEQYEGDTVPQSDIFALGATLYLLLTGKRLFGGGAPAVIRTVQCDDVIKEPAFTASLDRLDPELTPILRRCLAYDPTQRWESADALATAFRRVLVRLDGPSLGEVVRGFDAETGGDDPPTATAHPAAPLPEKPHGPFVGRDVLLDAVFGSLQRGRLAVLVGAAGIGKSRLALEFAHRRTGPCAWVGLGSCQTAEEAFAAIARASGLVMPDAIDPVWLADALDARSGLMIVLDHAEGLELDAWNGLSELFSRSQARWLVTARRAPTLVDARVLRVPPLSDEAAEELFRRSSPREVDGGVLSRILAKLGGMPLSIELAAAGSEEVESRNLLHDLPTLTDLSIGSHTDAGHREVLAAVRWSWDRLTDEERDALVQLSVFEGPFRIEDAEAVVRLRSGRWLMDVLDGLLRNRLVIARAERFSVLASVKSFAASELSGSTRWARVRRRHAAHFARLGTPETIARLDMPDSHVTFALLSASHDDLAAAFDFAVAAAPESLAGVATARLALILYTGPTAEGLEIVQVALDAVHTPASLAELLRLGFVAAFRAGRPDRARVFAEIGRQAAFEGSALGHFLWCQAVLEPPAERWHWLDRAEAEGQRHGDSLLLAKVENSRSVLVRKEGDLETAEHYEDRALVFAIRSGSEAFQALVLQNRAKRRAEQGDLDGASEDYLTALQIHTRCRSAAGYVLALLELGALRLRQGNLADASRMLATCEERVRSIGAVRAIPMAMYWRGALAWMSDRPDSATVLWQVAMERSDASEEPTLRAATRTALANAALATGKISEARALLDAIDPAAPARERLDALGVRVRLEVLEGRDPSRTVAELENLGRLIGTPWAEATVLLAVARRDHQLGRKSDAARRARAVADQLGVTAQSPLRRALDSLGSVPGP